MMRQLTEVLVYLHENGKRYINHCVAKTLCTMYNLLYNFSDTSLDHTDIVHRDLKLENVLLKSPIDSSGKIDIKVSIMPKEKL